MRLIVLQSVNVPGLCQKGRSRVPALVVSRMERLVLSLSEFSNDDRGDKGAGALETRTVGN